MARNDGALFSERGHTRSVELAVADPDLQATLEKRADIPPAYRKRLVEIAQQRAQQVLDAEFGGMTASAVSRAAAPFKAPTRDDALLAAEVAVSAQARKGGLDEAFAAWLKNGQETEALVALAQLAGVPSRMAIQACEGESHEPLLFLVRSVRFGWRILKLFLSAKDGHVPAPEVMQSAMEAFQALSVATALRIVRFTATREHAQNVAAGAK